MGMFDFLKKLFVEEEKKEIAIDGKKFSFLEIEKWMDENTKEIADKFSSDVNSEFLNIEEGIKDIENGLRELENFNIEREINERAKTMILQNKENYIKSTQRLLEFFKNGMKIERNVRKVDDFTKLALWEIDLFTRQTTRSFYISSSIIGKEFEKVLGGLKRINTAIISLKTMDKTNQRMIETAKDTIEEVKKDAKIAEKLESMKGENDKKIEALKKDIENLKEKEKRIKTSKEWKQKEELNGKIEMMESDQEKKRVELRNLFMNIEKLIQKYAWNRKKKEILAYIEDTISALKEDDGLKILNDLDEIRKDIEENVYTADNEKKKQYSENVNKIGEKVLLDFLEDDLKFEDELRKMREEAGKIKIEELNYEELNGKIGERDEENLKIEKKKKAVLEDIYSRKQRVSLLIEDIGNQIGKQIKVDL